MNFAHVLRAAGFNIKDSANVTPKRLMAILKEYREHLNRTNCTKVEMALTRDQNGKPVMVPKYIDTDKVLEITPPIADNELTPHRLELHARNYVTGRTIVGLLHIDQIAVMNADTSVDEAKLIKLVDELTKDHLLYKVIRYYGAEGKEYHVLEHKLRPDGRWSSKVLTKNK